MPKTLPKFSLLLILLLALALRLPFLNGSFWLDEAAQALESARPWSQQLNIAEDFQPPLLHLIVKLALYGGTSEWWLRTVGALLPGLITIFVTYHIGKKLVSPRTGALAAVLLATSSFHIFYSQELRPYSLPAMFALISWWVLVQPSKNKLPHYGALALLTAAGLYSSFLYVFVVVAQVIVVGVQSLQTGKQEDSIHSIAAFGLGGLLFTPWLPFFEEQLAVGGALRQALPGWEAVVSLTQAKALFITLGKFILGTQDLDLLSAQMIGISIFFLFMGIIVWNIRQSFTQQLSPVVVFAIWFAVPILLAWIISFWIPVLQPKRVLFCLPALYLLVATLFEHTQLKLKWVFIGLLIMFNVWGMASLYTNPLVQREDWRSLHAELVADYPADSSVAVFSFPEPFAPWRWYDDGTYPTISTGTLHINQSDLRTALKTVPGYRYVIVFDYLRDLTDPDDLLIEAVRSYGYQEQAVYPRPLIGQARIFSKPSSILSTLNL